jgi:hypothetical protein
MLGAVTINTIVTFGLIAVVMVAGLVATAPHFAVLKVTVATLAVGLVVPVVFFPFSYTLWAAIDLAMRPIEPAEEADAITWLAARARGDAPNPTT